MRSTKIVATLGPAVSSEAEIADLFHAGADVFRLNFSHGTHDEHRDRYQAIRNIERDTGRSIAVMADLQGPKLRIGTFLDAAIELTAGQTFALDLDSAAGNCQRVNLPHPEIFAAVTIGTELLLDDGKIRLRVDDLTAEQLTTTVQTGGRLSDRKGVNVPNAVLPISSLSDKDRTDLEFALTLGVDWIALSFVQRPADVLEARRLAGDRASILIKLEKPAAMDHLPELIDMSDAVMVARGDLGVEMPPEMVPILQKRIVAMCREQGKPVIDAGVIQITPEDPQRASQAKGLEGPSPIVVTRCLTTGTTLYRSDVMGTMTGRQVDDIGKVMGTTPGRQVAWRKGRALAE